ncbi:vanadium-dependent haloperoxidase [uncultured Jannaschia sp.]|uniref:vanadium-dependent haloperoxidase n=1 Tax=uncultured Jannaschia sp. TaxID=293347 RepID=UPI00260FAC84|nr:vanadium-dependent haloperoxidase [uncultured Jannaschia sp.]
MSTSIGIPVPDCNARRIQVRARRVSRDRVADQRHGNVTIPNGEEVAFDLGYALNYHKGLPHDVDGMVHRESYNDMVHMLCTQEYGALETLPVGGNRTAKNGSTTNPPRYATTDRDDPGAGKHLGYRRLTSPCTGHVFDTEGADAGDYAIAPAPLADSDEVAAEMAELYVMALLRDASFADIAAGTAPTGLNVLVDALKTMPWFNGSFQPTNEPERRRYATRRQIGGSADLFRGSTTGAQTGPVLSQFLLMGNDNTGATFRNDAGAVSDAADPASSFVGTGAEIGREDGFILYGTQVIDQRSIVAQEGADYLTTWAAWLDCQNGVDFNGLDMFRQRRRFLVTPRDIATYVHYDALYQAYLNACLLMLADGKFTKDRGLPETKSRTRAAFASFGGPHILSLVTEVATRALKAVWRQKWMHHRRTRPEVLAALLTLHENDPARFENEELRATLAGLRGKIPSAILDAVASRNGALNDATANPDPAIRPMAVADLPDDFPAIDDAKNFLLPMAFPEGSPTHPAYGAGHATVAGACVTVLKAFFEMYAPNGTPLPWPHDAVFVAERMGGSGSRLADIGPVAGMTIEGELDKLAANIAIARNMAGVHYYTDYFESLRLGERIAASILEDHMALYDEPVSMSFTSFDGERVRIASNGDAATVRVTNGAGRISPELWFDRYAA